MTREELTGALMAHLAEVEPVLAHYGYAGMFATILAEGMGIPAPGHSVFLAGTILAARGDLNIGWVLAIGWFATVAGDSLGYLVGRRYGRQVLGRLGVNERHLQRVEDYFRRHGSATVIASPFIEGLRQYCGIVAGSMEMPWWRFFTAVMISGALWAGIWAAGVYYFKPLMHAVLRAYGLTRPYFWVLSLGLLGLLIAYLLQRRKSRA